MSDLHDLSAALAQAATAWPDRIAYRFKDQTVSYAQLSKQAQALAACLADQGVRPGDRVAIAMTKGLEMPVAIQGIWMVGAAFVPLDPAAPIERLTGILEDCDISVVISAERNAALAAQLADARAITIIGAQVQNANCAMPKSQAAFQPHANKPDDLAYIIFTSGSTGVPKGICHTHASGLGFAQAWQETYGLRPDDVFFSTVPLHFDFSLADFLTPATVGAMTELVPEPVLLFPASLAALLEKSGGTIWSSVPYSFIQLCERGAVETRDLSCLRWLIYGGESMPPNSLEMLRNTFTAKISNSYGPAEVNQVSEYTVPENHPSDQPIPIGQPLPHANFAQSDDGELLVASTSMMQGYWKRPELNAKVFVEHHGQRFYRTGDRVSQNTDGLWMFNGREDRQIKLRGHRIELDEVEMAMVSHSAVSEAAAIIAPDKVTLWGFVTVLPNAEITEAALRTHIAKTLPNYAIPDRIKIRASFQKTSTGKINRIALIKDAT